MVVAGTASAAVPKSQRALKAHKALAAHPPFAKMIVEAIAALKEKGGSSRQAILKYIKSHYEVDERVAEINVRRVLVSATTAGKLVRVKGAGASGSFKVSQKADKPAAVKVTRRASVKSKATPVKKAPVAKRAAPKPRKTVNKPKKAPATKPKKAVVKRAKTMKPRKPAVKKTPKKAAVAKK